MQKIRKNTFVGTTDPTHEVHIDYLGSGLYGAFDAPSRSGELLIASKDGMLLDEFYVGLKAAGFESIKFSESVEITRGEGY